MALVAGNSLNRANDSLVDSGGLISDKDTVSSDTVSNDDERTVSDTDRVGARMGRMVYLYIRRTKFKIPFPTQNIFSIVQ